ncbi:hypothetical protein MMC24_001744 [Lignoscripta atroalba]|nr:hypothetical protein [Lignoscripta atroalba]
MTDTTLHTELEVFLFFQSLRVLGPESPVFSRISELLKENDFIHSDKAYEPDRLDPDSLKALYLQLLKEEIRDEAAKSDGNSPEKDGVRNANPRKRKRSTPPLQSVKEAAEHNYLLPQLADRLYTRYREHAIRVIQEEEERYRSLQKDIREIEEGKWDAELQEQERLPRKDSKGVSSIQTLLRHDSSETRRLDEGQRNGTNPGRGLNNTAAPATTTAFPTQDPHNSTVTEEPSLRLPGAIAGGDVFQPQRSITVNDSSGHHSRTPSLPGVQPALAPHHDAHQTLSRPPSQSRMVDSHAPFLPPLPGHGYNMASPSSEVHRRLPHQQPQIGVPPSASPRLNQVPLVLPERSPASPIILPPPKGMLRSSGSPTGPLDALADMAGQQYRANQSIASPRQGPIPGTQQHPNQLPQPRNYGQRAYPYYDSQSHYAAPYSPYNQHPLQPYPSPTQASVPTYPSSAQGYGQGPLHGSFQQYQSPLPPYTHYQGYALSPAGYQYPPPQSFNQGQPFRPPIQSTPALGKRRPPRLSPIDTSASSTRWKNTGQIHHGRSPGSPIQPRPEDMSPLSPRAPSPLAEPSKTRGEPARGQKEKQFPLGGSIESHEDLSSIKARSKSTRGDRSRGRTSRSRGARAGSTASSAIAGSIRTRTRSQSMVSHTDELSMDNYPNTSRKIKPEPPATPAAADDNISMASTPADETSRKSTRRRRDTLRSLESSEAIRPNNKRKRPEQQTPDLPPPLDWTIRFSKPNHVLATRNFPRTSATIMNDITGHKLAGMFAKPLTEREAPGYKDLIYRPQDLKSIKSAISAGSRAIAAAPEPSVATPAGEAGSPVAGGSLGGSSSKNAANLWVPVSEEVVPPKGIVNSAQLEREICRMLANAVMFNPDPKRGLGPAFRTRSKVKGDGAEHEDEEPDREDDGDRVVRDTREMFDTVEKSVMDWRAAERAVEDMNAGRLKGRGGDEKVEEDEVDELAGEDVAGSDRPDESVGAPAKRRRRG